MKPIGLVLVLSLCFYAEFTTAAGAAHLCRYRPRLSWIGPTRSITVRTVTCTYPESWESDVIDPLDENLSHRSDPFYGFKLSFFPSGEPSYTHVSVTPEEQAGWRQVKKRILEDLRQYPCGKKWSFKKGNSSGYPSFDMEYEWCEASTDGNPVYYRHLERYIFTGHLVYRLCYAALREDFNTCFPEGLFIMESCSIAS